MCVPVRGDVAAAGRWIKVSLSSSLLVAIDDRCIIVHLQKGPSQGPRWRSNSSRHKAVPRRERAGEEAPRCRPQDYRGPPARTRLQ